MTPSQCLAALIVVLGLCAVASTSNYAAATTSAPTATPIPIPLTGPGITPLRNEPGNYWDADLAVPLVVGQHTYLLEGDVLDSRRTWRAANAIGKVVNSTVLGFGVEWHIDSGTGLPLSFFPRIGKSTVPAGGIALAPSTPTAPTCTVYVFMMNVTDWRDGSPGNVSAQAMLIKGTARTDGSAPPVFSQVPVWADAEQDAPLVNAVPVLNPHDGFVYIFASGRYRASPVLLARTSFDDAGMTNPNAYLWWTGLAWGARSQAASILPSPALVPPGVGELSAMWDAGSASFVLCFFDYAENLEVPALLCQSSQTPWIAGSWTSPPTTLIDGSATWFPQGSYGPYGGYILPASGFPTTKRPQNQQTPFTVLLSLWVPYRVYALQMNI